MIDSLYYGGKPCACCSGSPRNDLGETIFSADILEDFLRKIYDGFDVSSEIEPSAWREVLRILNEGAVKGLTQGGERQHTPQFLQAIKHSNEVFSAFKCHSMGVKMAERLRDKDGNLRPFKEWREAVQPIASHHVGAWLKTEYDTAVLRAHQGSLWQEFERNKDILPNLRWMPTTSVSPENVHKGYWTSRLTLPVDDPFWQDNHPANRWNCKCSLEATSDKADTGHVAEMARQDNTAQQGLENNPRDGHLFSDKHPYFPKNCASCPFKKQSKLKNWIGRLFNGGDGKDDCYKNCPYVDEAIEQARNETEKKPTEKKEETQSNEGAKTETPKSGLTDEQKAYRKALQIEAKRKFQDREVETEIGLVKITGVAIKEFINQPHEKYFEKNELVRKLPQLIEEAKYIGYSLPHKNKPNVIYDHFFAIDDLGDNSHLIIHERDNKDLFFYGISEDLKFRDLKKKSNS